MASGNDNDSTIKEGEFRKFDIVTDHSDHHCCNQNMKGNNKNCFTDGGSNVYKHIMKEWKILEKNLPESIFVRVYEDRIDLLRAVIIGAQGTPYHDGLFFFDIVFPYGYPMKPPHVFYHSHGLRLNPNLYKDGRVCLSLLNTWHGAVNENWNPAASTILQVLVSLQGLVLNQKPYYNEPGRKPAISWEIYNQDVFALSCKTMLFVLRKPPKNFETFVAAHFRERAYAILRACKAYTNGNASIGSFSDKGLSHKNKIQVSRSFKKTMDKLYPDLFVAFTENGASLQNLIETPIVEDPVLEDPVVEGPVLEDPVNEKKEITPSQHKRILKSVRSFVGKSMCFSCLKMDA